MQSLSHSPLADQVRPRELGDFFGQEELLGPDSFLRRAIENDQVPSMILWGPPGTGKTTLANIIAQKTGSDFVELSGVSSGKKDLQKVVEKARANFQNDGRRTVLFVDEIHRWTKTQQDALLPYVEKGDLVLIGATTENPGFEVISALLSRSRVFVLKRLEKEDLKKILERAVKILAADKTWNTKFSAPLSKVIDPAALSLVAALSNGDARTALNTLEASLHSVLGADKNKNKDKNEFQKTAQVTVELVRQIFQKSHLLYDKTGEEHYNIISALHKSMRGGDANAALYYLARMLEGGEDPLYVARRLVRFAAEDVGLADNHALVLANACFEACRNLGLPECNVHLAQCVIYLSRTKKSILAYSAYAQARKDVEKFGNLAVPLHLRNAPVKLMKDLGYGKNYKYTPTQDSSDQEYFPKELKGRKYF